ncbi:unnamed protein product [Allacma fusca]|uniref:Uncharacterized protein n=1 Tax=Allacma fusca TaxID=39272 RepID=A0A8J2LLR0_9HEXA|nr:unnamed protein product [Allacma fusca]
MVNVNPLAEKLLQLAKPLAGKFLERMEIHGTNKRKWMPRILRKIPRDQLPEAYGGYKNFKPIEFYG